VVRPHREFRLFLAMDPRHGEVSRAMRNRGVELYLLPEIVGTGGDLETETATQVSVSARVLGQVQSSDSWQTHSAARNHAH
jgi:midasin (ATPase involved in ribosome maturation)